MRKPAALGCLLALATTVTAQEPAQLDPLDAPAAVFAAGYGSDSDFGVEAITRAGDRLIVGGDFSHVGQRTGALALLNAGDGSIRGSLPSIAGSADASAVAVEAIVPDGTGGAYIGGSFREVGGLPRAGLARILPSRQVDPDFRADVRGTVDALELSGGRLYVAGDFESLSGRSRVNLGAVAATTGVAVEGFDAAVIGDAVDDLAITGERLYVGGSFFRVGGVARRNLAAVSASTGAVDAGFDPSAPASGSPAGGERPPDADQRVHALAVNATHVYVGGEFTTIGATSRSRLASLDAVTGAVDTAFDPAPADTVGGLFLDGDRLYVSGPFNGIAGVPRGGLAAIQAATGAFDSTFAPQVTGEVAHAGSTVYVKAAEGLVALDRAGNRVGGFEGAAAGGSARAAVPVGDTLYVGGNFAAIGARRHENLAAFDPATGVDETWRLSADGVVEGLVPAGDMLLLRGRFTSVGGLPRRGLAAIDPQTASVVERFRPPPLPAGARVVVGRSRIYVIAGRRFGGLRRANGLFAIDRRTGRPLRGFRVRTRYRSGKRRGSGAIRTVVERGRRLYVGGMFTQLGGRRRGGLGAVHVRTSRLVRPFRPRLRARRGRPGVGTLHAHGRHLYAIGYFTSADRRGRGNLARLALRTGRLDRRFRPPEINSRGGGTLSFSRRQVYLTASTTIRELDGRTGAVGRQGEVITGGFREKIKQALPVGDRLYAVGTFGPGSRFSATPLRPIGIAAFDRR